MRKKQETHLDALKRVHPENLAVLISDYLREEEIGYEPTYALPSPNGTHRDVPPSDVQKASIRYEQLELPLIYDDVKTDVVLSLSPGPLAVIEPIQAPAINGNGFTLFQFPKLEIGLKRVGKNLLRVVNR